MKLKRVFWVFIIILNIVFINVVFADTAYLPLEYHTVRYNQENGKGTTIWYAVIPAKYKMHYAYGNDLVKGGETPSSNARRHNATIAVNSQFLGFPTINGNILNIGDSAAGYEFYVTKKSNPVADWDVFNVYGVNKYSEQWGLDFKDINLGFDYYGNKLPYGDQIFMYMALYNQLVMNGTETNSTITFLTDRHPRTWLAYDYQGNQYVAVSAGRDVPISGKTLSQAGLSGAEIIAATKQFMTSNIKTLYNLDGGGSCGFIYKGNKISPNYDDNYTTERSIGGIFYWKAEDYKIQYDCDIGMKPEHGLADYVVTENGPFTLASNLCIYDGYHQDGWVDNSGKTWASSMSGTWNYDNSNAGISDYTLKLTAKYVSDDILSFKDGVNVDENKKIIYRVNNGMTVQDFIGMINTNGTLSFKTGNRALVFDDVIKTGDSLNVDLTNSTLIYTFSVFGDFNKDGNTDKIDLKEMARHIINNNTIDNNLLYAADYDNNKKIKINDVLQFLNRSK